jgi:probable F420-dependent oxidoreductase
MLPFGTEVSHHLRVSLDRIGIWTSQLGLAPPEVVARSAQALERAGFASIWVPESTWTDPFVLSTLLLSSTERIAVCTGIARVHGRAAQTMLNGWAGLTSWYPGRFVLGLGISHQPTVERALHRSYSAPVPTMRAYLDELAAARFDGLVAEPKRLVLAALGPKMLDLARDRSDGAHPYLSPIEHTRFARGVLGDRAWLVPEVKVVLESDPATARAVARRQIAGALRLTNYSRNMARFGFSPDDVSNAADSVVDALVAWGEDDDVAARIQAHLDAGADQVAVQVIDPGEQLPTSDWQRLAQIFN